MLYRKISKEIKAHFQSNNDKILIIEGARQVGKTWLVKEFARLQYKTIYN